MGYNPWGHKESDTTERLTLSLRFFLQVIKLHRAIAGHSKMERAHPKWIPTGPEGTIKLHGHKPQIPMPSSMIAQYLSLSMHL